MSPHDVLEENLQRLFARAWHPVLPEQRFVHELRQRVEAEVARLETESARNAGTGAVLRRERDVSVQPFRTTARPLFALAAAALVLLAGLVATWFFVRGSPAPASPDVLVAQGHVAVREADGWRVASADELERGFAAGAGAVGVATPPDQPFTVHLGSSGRVELGPRTRAEVAVREPDGARTIALDAGSASLRRDDAGEPWRVETPHGLVALARGVLSWSFAPDGPGGGACSLVELATGLAWIMTEPRAELSVGQRTWLRGGRVVVAMAVVPPDGLSGRTAAGTGEPGPGEPGSDGHGSDEAGADEAGADAQPDVPGAAADGPPSLAGTLQVPAGVGAPQSFRITLLRRERLPDVSQPNSTEFHGTPSFAFEGLRDGSYDVYFEAEGFATERLSGVEVRTGVTADASFAPTPELSLRGEVVDDATGAPIAGAIVLAEAYLPAQVVPFAPDDESMTWRSRAVTAADGTFRIGHLAATPTRLRATIAGYAASWTGELAGGAQAEPVTIRMARGGTATGLVQHDDGSPWIGAFVIASRMVEGPLAERMSFGMAQTDDAGRYTIGDLPPGGYVVFSFDPAGAAGIPSIRELRIRGSETVVLDLGPTSQRTRVVGVLRDASGQPLPDMDLMLASEHKDEKWVSARSDDEGAFTFAGVDPGAYLVCVGSAMGQFTSVATIVVALAPEERHDIALPPASLNGVVRMPDGTPHDGADVILFALEGGKEEFAGRAVSDAHGRFQMRGLAAGTYRASAHSRRTGIAPIARTFEVAEAPVEIDLQLVAGVEVLVRVSNTDGAPAGGVPVAFTDETGTDWQFTADDRTDAQGNLTIPGVPTGRWTIAPAGAAAQRIDLELGERRVIDFQIGGDPATKEKDKR